MLGDSIQRADVAGPGFLNLVMSDVWHRDRAGRDSGRRRPLRRRRCGSGRAHADRVRVRQPHRPAGRRQRSACGLRRCAGADPRASRTRGLARVLLQRRRRPDPAARRVSAGPGPRRGRAGGRISGRTTWPSWRARSPAPRRGVPISSRRPRSSCCSRGSRRRSSGTACATTRSSASRRCTPGHLAAWTEPSRALEDAGHLYRSEGATWLRTTTFGDDKDRVVIRSNGEPTYLLADVAYLQNKLERGFERQLLPVGADHHAYVRELKAAIAALGGDPDTARGTTASVRPFGRRRRAGGDVQADGLVRHARRSPGRDRRRCHAVLHAAALARPHRRPRSGAGPAAIGREPGLLRAVRPRSHLLNAVAAESKARAGGGQRGGRVGGRRPAYLRAQPDPEAGVVPGRGGRGGAAPRATPDRGLRPGSGPGLHRVLPRLPGGGRAADRGRVAAGRAVGRVTANHRAVAVAARGERARSRCSGRRRPTAPAAV